MLYTPSVVISRQYSWVELELAGVAVAATKTWDEPPITPEIVNVSKAPPAPLFLVTMIFFWEMVQSIEKTIIHHTI